MASSGRRTKMGQPAPDTRNHGFSPLALPADRLPEHVPHRISALVHRQKSRSANFASLQRRRPPLKSNHRRHALVSHLHG
ncbi:hypothetical protein BaRGS_00008768 [Batillaria attramentaria]|uniref:Uncharacterized protein n=1 Tax=Batillaria attramentaria TaxID=370345 RepID=A0ABD0LKH8_9CAEN